MDQEIITNEESQTITLKKRKLFKKIFKGVGFGWSSCGWWVSLYLVYYSTIFVRCFCGLINDRVGNFIIFRRFNNLGTGCPFIGTPIAIGLASYFFIFFLFLSIIALIIWGIIYIFGFNVSFGSVWDGIWLVIKILILVGMAFFGISSFIEAIKRKM